eukprot:CAMPEP_0196770792 /NCGR_PEP_ID=MMETSP1104-20130614/1339_1 /TAXON_ID=33652 /ORGANISM="Cafeteria sp., Strain Caron Lab Isolate" /LENGTH=349 /DNA_ID=CAMNT_0042140907 /DNA_START=1 /DNA_END=1050 /DNA_ORIENTATION=+
MRATGALVLTFLVLTPALAAGTTLEHRALRRHHARAHDPLPEASARDLEPREAAKIENEMFSAADDARFARSQAAETQMVQARASAGQAAAASASTAASTRVKGDSLGQCKNCIYVMERIKQGYQYMLPSICVEVFHKTQSQEEYTICHNVLAALSVWGHNVRHWFKFGCYKSEPYGAQELVKPCPSHVICSQITDLEKKAFCSPPGTDFVDGSGGGGDPPPKEDSAPPPSGSESGGEAAAPPPPPPTVADTVGALGNTLLGEGINQLQQAVTPGITNAASDLAGSIGSSLGLSDSLTGKLQEAAVGGATDLIGQGAGALQGEGSKLIQSGVDAIPQQWGGLAVGGLGF